MSDGDEKVLLTSVKVGDGNPRVPAQILMDDLTVVLHDESKRYYKQSDHGCWRLTYAKGQDTREDFEAGLREVGSPDDVVALYLAEWDKCSRPIAVIHWWEAGPDFKPPLVN